jgi:hypothetical protein
VSVKFAPTKAGGQTGTLTIHDNASPATQTVALSGTGTDFTIAVSPATFTVAKGQSVNATITVTPVDNFAGIVNLKCSAPAPQTCSVNPTSLTIRGSALTSALTITANSVPAGNKFTVAVTGGDGALTHAASVSVTVK